jgi:sarcosine oxidase, subunit beta
MSLSSSSFGKAAQAVIIGGGASGALIAARLAERGFHVIALEKAVIGNGSSGRSAACIRAQWGTSETAACMLYAEWFYLNFHDLLHSTAEDRPWIIKQNGYLFLYEHPQQAVPPWQPTHRQRAARAWQAAQDYVAMQQKLGVAVELLESHEVQRRWPHILAERLIGATWGPNDGFLNHDLIYSRGFARAQALGAELRQQVEVTGAKVRDGRILNLETSSGPVEGDWFINATGAWAPRVSRCIGGMELPISPVKRFLYYLKPTQPIMSAEDWNALPMTLYGVGPERGAFSRPDGESLMIGWAHEADSEPDFTDSDQDLIPPAFHHLHGLENYGYAVLAELDRFAPDLANCGGLHATTCGYYEMTPDSSPLIGIDAKLGNLVHAAGFSGHGLMHAPVTATVVEAIITNEVNDGLMRLPPPYAEQTIPLRAFDPSRNFAQSHQETMVF